MTQNKKFSSIKKEGVIFVFITGLIFMVVIFNVFVSQTVPPLYFRFVEESTISTIYYLNHIKTLPIFSSELIKYKNRYGGWVEKEIFKIEEQRNKEIATLEEVLIKNPKSRDILSQLFILYDEKGDKIKAQEYLRRAKEIDPSI